MSIGISLPQLPTARKPIPKTENSDFIFLPPKDPPAGQPNMDGLIPIIMAIVWMALLASSTSSSLLVSLFELLRTLIVCPYFSKVIHPSSTSFSRVETRLLIVDRAGRAGLSSHSHSLFSDLNTQSSLILRSYKHVCLSVGRADLSSQSPVVQSFSSSVNVPRCPSDVKPRPWTWQSTPPSSNRTTT